MTFADIAKEFLLLVSGQLDQHTSQKGIVKVEGPTKVTLFTPAHIQFAKYGRGPGKKPPLDNILAYIKREGIIFEGMDERGTAFAIQASIGKNGTQNYVPNAPNAIEEAIQSALEKYNKNLSKFFATETQKQVDEIYRDTFPEKMNYKI